MALFAAVELCCSPPLCKMALCEAGRNQFLLCKYDAVHPSITISAICIHLPPMVHPNTQNVIASVP